VKDGIGFLLRWPVAGYSQKLRPQDIVRSVEAIRKPLGMQRRTAATLPSLDPDQEKPPILSRQILFIDKWLSGFSHVDS
jgi:hypothetical protein